MRTNVITGQPIDQYRMHVDIFMEFYQRFTEQYHEAYAQAWIATRPFHIGGAGSAERDQALRTVRQWMIKRAAAPGADAESEGR